MEFLDPWYQVSDPALVAELKRELPPGHALYGKEVRVLARRMDRDDVLYEICDGSQRLAKVHLTFAKERDPIWPLTEFFSSQAEWIASMHVDSADYGA